MDFHIIHKTQKWVAAICSSQDSAENWLKQFNPKIWMDKTLKSEDFEIVPKKIGRK